MLGQPNVGGSLPISDWSMWTGKHSLPLEKPVQADGKWRQFIRGKLDGAGSWNGLYADAGNTGSSPDQLVKDPLGVLWYGEPGSEHMLERHARSVSPLAINGRLYVQGMEVVMGYDAYNGTQLWERTIPGAVRARADVDGSNIFANDNGVPHNQWASTVIQRFGPVSFTVTRVKHRHPTPLKISIHKGILIVITVVSEK